MFPRRSVCVRVRLLSSRACFWNWAFLLTVKRDTGLELVFNTRSHSHAVKALYKQINEIYSQDAVFIRSAAGPPGASDDHMPAPAPPAIGSIVTIASRTSMPGGLKIYLPNMPKSTAAAFNHMPRCPPAASPHLAPTHPDASHTHSAHLRATRRAVPTCGGGAHGRRDITQGGQLLGLATRPALLATGPPCLSAAAQ